MKITKATINMWKYKQNMEIYISHEYYSVKKKEKSSDTCDKYGCILKSY